MPQVASDVVYGSYATAVHIHSPARVSVLAQLLFIVYKAGPCSYSGEARCIFTRIRRSIVSASCFYWLRQLRRSRRLLDIESAATLVTHS